MTDKDTQPEMIEVPAEWREPRSEDTQRVIGGQTVSRAASTGRYNNGVVPLAKQDGVPVEFAGFDAHRMQPRTIDSGDTRERPTSLSQDDIEEV